MTFQPDFSSLAPVLAAEGEAAWRAICERAGDNYVDKVGAAAQAHELGRVLACSPFAAALLRGRPGLLLELLHPRRKGGRRLLLWLLLLLFGLLLAMDHG